MNGLSKRKRICRPSSKIASLVVSAFVWLRVLILRRQVNWIMIAAILDLKVIRKAQAKSVMFISVYSRLRFRCQDVLSKQFYFGSRIN